MAKRLWTLQALPGERQCGSCQVLLRPGLFDDGDQFKAPFEMCQHQCAKGCAIYEAKPSSCTVFACQWLTGFGARRDRPDRLGLVVERTQENASTVIASEVWPGSRKAKRAKKILEEIYADSGISALIVTRQSHPPVVSSKTGKLTINLSAEQPWSGRLWSESDSGELV